MFSVIFALIILVFALVVPRFLPQTEDRQGHRSPLVPSFAVRIAQGLLCLWAGYLVISTSIIMVPSNKVGIVTRVYGATSMPEGHVIATKGETGTQAEIIPPGTFKVSLLYNIYNSVQYTDIVQIPQGFYGRIFARDGAPLPAGAILADAWKDADFNEMLNAEYFMSHGGQKGTQLSVLKPGTYPINTALFEIKVGYKANGKDIQKATDDVWDVNGHHTEDTPLDTSVTIIPAGFVGVVRSSVADPSINCRPETAKVDNSAFSDSLAAEVVPQGCRGIWKVALGPNDYYLNRDAYDIVLVDTKVQALEFYGGYARRYIDLKLLDNGQFQQTERHVDVPVPANAVDPAVNSKLEGWEVPQELRVVIQVPPERAPVIVAAVGGLKDVEQRIMIPAIRSHVRNVLGGNITVKGPDGKDETRQTRVLDTIEQRSALEDEILKRVVIDGRRAGVDVKEIRLGESVIPPELLLARQRQQLADQLKKAYEQEKVAQDQRSLTEAARATADKQAALVGTQIELQQSKLTVEKRQNDGDAERKFIESLAAGQKAQVAVLGEDKVVMLQALDKLLAKPEVWGVLAQIRLPTYMNFGSGFDPNLAVGILKDASSGKILEQHK